MFNQEGLHISKDGYFYTRYSFETESYQSLLLSTKEIEQHLLTPVILHDALVKDVFLPIIDSELFTTIFHRIHWNDLMDEIKDNHWPEYNTDKKTLDDIEFVEIYDATSFDKKKNILANTMGKLHFHGVSFKVEKELLNSQDIHKVNEYQRQHWSISPQPISDYMNYPIKIGTFSIYDEHSHKAIIKDTNMNINLFSLIEAICFDMSFYGVKEGRKRKHI